MPFSEADRDSVPQFPRTLDSSSSKSAETLLAFNSELPHLQMLFAMQARGDKAAVSLVSDDKTTLEFLPAYSQVDRRHSSPWASKSNEPGVAGKKQDAADKTNASGKTNTLDKTNSSEKPKGAAKPLEAGGTPALPGRIASDKPNTSVKQNVEVEKKPEQKLPEQKALSEQKALTEQKALPDLTLDGQNPKRVGGDGKQKPSDEQNALPSIDLDSQKALDASAKVFADLQHWLEQFAKSSSDNVSKPKNDSIEKPAQAPEPKAVPQVIEGANGSSWKKDGAEWNFYNKLGQKENKFEGKASSVEVDSDGNTQITLKDGGRVTEKKDGSTLSYDKDNRLQSLTYADGSSRKFQWDGNDLIGMSSKQGEWTRSRDQSGKVKNEWTQKGQSSAWQGELNVDAKTGVFKSGSTEYRTDLSVAKANSDGTSQITYPNKDKVTVAKDGQVSEINYADGSTRKFFWANNADAKGDPTLKAVMVNTDGKYYYHSGQNDGKWNVQTWDNNKWSDAQPEILSFKFDNKKAEYAYTDSTDGVNHLRQPGGLEQAITRDGGSLEYKDNKLVGVKQQDSKREFDWQGDKLTAIRDGAQGKIWTPAQGGGWQSDKGDKRSGNASVSPNGDIEFKDGDKSTIVKMDGAEYKRIANAKEGSQVDVRDGVVQVKAGDNSTRTFATAADGKEVTRESVTRDGKTESWTRGDKLANGNYTWTNDQNPEQKQERKSVTQEDGKLSIEYADGRKYQASTSGAEKLENDKAGSYTEFRGGMPSEIKYPDGTIRRFTFDGGSNSPKSVEIVSPDGSKTNIDRVKDGVYNYKTASSEMKWNIDYKVSRDGSYSYVDHDDHGKTTTRKSDGLTIVEDPKDKSHIEKYSESDVRKVVRDGKELELVRDKNKEPIELKDSASNTSYKKDQNGEWKATALDNSKPFNKLDDLTRKGTVSLDESGKVSFIGADGTLVRQIAGGKGDLVSCKSKTLEACLQNDSMTEAQKHRLTKNVDEYTSRTDISPKDKSVFLENLTKAAQRTDISNAEKSATYAQLERLLESKSDKVFNAADRAKLAEQLVWHVANPQDNAQGQNPNCQVTVIRGRLLYEKPSEFARMMTDVITTGQFVTKDGSTIKVPGSSLTIGKGSEESTFPPEDGSRTWLGKVSDVTCANIFWQRQTQAPSGEAVPAGQLVYRQDPPSGRKDTGARVYKEPGDGYMYAQNDVSGKLLQNPTLYAKDIADTYKQITGPTNNVVLAVDRTNIKGGPGVALVSEEQLHNLLRAEGGVHIAQIWTGTDWVWKEPSRKYDIKPKDTSDDEHVVLVKDYDPVTRTVAVDNSWSSVYDHNARDRRITLHELYQAMAKQN